MNVLLRVRMGSIYEQKSLEEIFLWTQKLIKMHHFG